MREVGIDLAGRKPKRLTVEMQLHADWAVTMGCGDVCPYVPTRVDDWDIPDPAGKSLDEVREIRDLIARARQRSRREPDRRDPVRPDIAPMATREAAPAADQRVRRHATTPEVIRGCADRILDDYDDVPIRSHIFTLAHKRTRECLRKDTCDVLEHTRAER